MDRMVHDGRREGVVTDKVGYYVVVFDDVAVDNVWLGEEPVDEVLFGEYRRQVEAFEILNKERSKNANYIT